MRYIQGVCPLFATFRQIWNSSKKKFKKKFSDIYTKTIWPKLSLYREGLQNLQRQHAHLEFYFVTLLGLENREVSICHPGGSFL